MFKDLLIWMKWMIYFWTFKRMKTFIAIIVQLILVVHVQAQIDTARIMQLARLFSYKSDDYVHIDPYKLKIRPYFSWPKVSLNAKNQGREEFIYHPNLRSNIGLELIHRGVAVSTSLSLPVSAGKINKYGQTKYGNLSTRITGRTYALSLFYLSYQGMYASTSNDVTWQNPLVRRDISHKNVGFELSLLPSGKMSVSAAWSQSERQLKSAGSLMLSIGYNVQVMDADSSVIPFNKKVYYPQISTLAHGFYNIASMKAGYAYTYVYRDAYISAFYTIGPAAYIGRVRYFDLSSKKLISGLITTYHTGIAVGYNKDLWFGNICWELEKSVLELQSEDFNNYRQSIRIGLGIRI